MNVGNVIRVFELSKILYIIKYSNILRSKKTSLTFRMSVMSISYSVTYHAFLLIEIIFASIQDDVHSHTLTKLRVSSRRYVTNSRLIRVCNLDVEH